MIYFSFCIYLFFITFCFFFFNDTATTEIYTLSLHDALPISVATGDVIQQGGSRRGALMIMLDDNHPDIEEFITVKRRSEEHTSELQSRLHLVCRLLLEKKKKIKK